jgi:hypothetical protein
VTKSQTIDTLKDILVKTYHPAAIYLYGSHAWGDVLVVVDQSTEKPYRRSVRGIRALRGLKINEDIIVHTKQEFEELSDRFRGHCLCVHWRKSAPTFSRWRRRPKDF